MAEYEERLGNRPHELFGNARGRAHLPKLEVTIEPDQTAYPCCGGSLHVIGEDRAELPDHVPSSLRVRLIRRPKLGCRACEGPGASSPGAGTSDGRRHGNGCARSPCRDQPIRRTKPLL